MERAVAGLGAPSPRTPRTGTARLRSVATLLGLVAISACSRDTGFEAENPAAGPGELAGRDAPLNARFTGGAAIEVEARPIDTPPNYQDCNADCQAYCAAQAFENPLDEGMCPALWGAGYDTRPVVDTEACRRVYADMTGRFPTLQEITEGCLGRPIGDTVLELIRSDEFVFQNQKRWADKLKFNNTAVNLERIYDADILVGKLYSGLIRYDEFVAVISAHPVFLRRYDTAEDRVAALFDLFVGRPPFSSERADMAKLYALWSNGYHDHRGISTRLPDSYVEHRCIGDDGEVDESTAGACTSILWGFNRVVLLPDFRSIDNLTWVGNLGPEEWAILQTPGRIIGAWPQVWERAISQVFVQYLGYDLTKYVPSVTQKMIEYVLAHGGDIRAVHYAVATSSLYLQSTTCGDASCDAAADDPPWTYGPLRQSEAEIWLDTLLDRTQTDWGGCDHRIPSADELVEGTPAAYRLVQNSRWRITDEGYVDGRYRSLAQTLGGCPDNLTAGRFKAVSILNTATQEAFVRGLCNPTLDSDQGIDAALVLPGGVAADAPLDAGVASAILEHQVGTYFGRVPSEAEVTMASAGADACSPKPCSAESFARPLCYALLSSSEMLFY
jgi:hypothetical protein